MNDRAEPRICQETVGQEPLALIYHCPLCKRAVQLVEPIDLQDLLCPTCDLCYEPELVVEEVSDLKPEDEAICEEPQSKDVLGRWLSGEPIQKYPQNESARLKEWCKNHPGFTGVALSLCVIFLLAIGLLSFYYLHTKNSFDDYKVAQKDEHLKSQKYQNELQQHLRKLQQQHHLLIQQREQKEREARLDFAHKLANRSENVLDSNPQLSLSLAVEAMSITQQENVPYIPSVHQILRDILSNRSVKRLLGHREAVTSLSFGPQGRLLASSSHDGTVRIWDLFSKDSSKSLAILTEHQSHVSVAKFSSDGHWLATGGYDATARLWDMTSADPAKKSIPLLGHKGRIGVATISPDSRWLATGTGGLSLSDSTVRLWDLSTQGKSASFEELIGHVGLIHVVEISANSHWLVTCGEDSTARLWDLTAKHPSAASLVLRGHAGPIWSAAFSADNHWLVTGGGGIRSGDKSVRLWDLTSPDTTSPLVLQGHQAGIRAVAISPDSRWLVTASDDRTVRVWNLENIDSSQQSIVLQGHTAEVLSLAMSNDGRWLVTGSADGTCQLWGFSEQGPESTAVVLRGHRGRVSSLAISPDSHLLASAGEDSSVLVWKLRLDELISSVIQENLETSYIGRRGRSLQDPEKH